MPILLVTGASLSLSSESLKVMSMVVILDKMPAARPAFIEDSLD